MQQLRSDSTANIARRYRHLFRLPTRNRTILYASLPILATTGIAQLVSNTSTLYALFSLLVSEVILLFSISFDRVVLRGRNKVATFRRLASASIISNSVWFLLTLVGLIITYIDFGAEIRFLSLFVLGSFFAISFRALIFGSLFYDRPWQGLPLALVQPVLLFVPIIFSPGFLQVYLGSFPIQSSIVGGLIAVFAIELYLSAINRPTKIRSFKPLELLQAFLNAWAVEDTRNLERFLEATSKERSVKSRILVLGSTEKSDRGSKNQRSMIVVPGIHPGPFYPIGSSNLPGEIYSSLHSDDFLPLTVHSISDHDLNLPSKKQVEHYVANLSVSNEIEKGTTMSLPFTKSLNKATVNGLAFGSSVLLTITQAPYGMEDFPPEVGREIETYAQGRNFKNVLVVDTHNSEGTKPNESECRDAVTIAKEVIDDMSSSPQQNFRVGFAHSSEVSGWSSRDVGPAGIGLLSFEVGGTEKFSLVIADSNNCVLGFRERLLERFERITNSRILELCTSDTHVTAAKTTDAKGYLALGDVVSIEKLGDLLQTLFKKVTTRLSPGDFSSSIAVSDVRTIGSEVLNDFSGLLDATSSVAKNGARVLAILAILITIAVAII